MTGDLTLEQFRRIEPFLGTAIRVYLMGNGEPLMNPHFVEMLERIKRRHVHVSFNTNGSLLDSTLIREIIAAGLDEVVYSIDSVTPSRYETIRKGASFQRLVEGVQGVNEEKRRTGSILPNMVLSCVAMSHNVEEFPDIVNFAAMHGFCHVHFETLLWQNDMRYQEFFQNAHPGNIPPDEIEKSLARSKEIAERAGIGISSPLFDGVAREGTSDKICIGEKSRSDGNGDKRIAGSKGKCVRQSSHPFCAEPWTTLFIAWNGDVRACCQGEACFGNLNDSTITDIWQGDALSKFRRTIAEGVVPVSCRTCVENRRYRNAIPEMEELLKGL
jgi:MoaA/NifB/PqqE/SkfB family radical SAM enzyme